MVGQGAHILVDLGKLPGCGLLGGYVNRIDSVATSIAVLTHRDSLEKGKNGQQWKRRARHRRS